MNIDSQNEEVWRKFRTGEVDINNQQIFMSILLKGLLYDLNRNLKIRGVNIPHYILNTGDDILYLEAKGYDRSKEPIDNTNEDYVYNVIPRCLVQPSNMNIEIDQLTSPYSNGVFVVEYDNSLYSFNAEFRRLPIMIDVSLKYMLDTFSDALQTIQQIMSKMAFINNFSINYLGNVIYCSYKIPDSMEAETNVEFDGLSTDSKTRNVNIEIEVESNIPIINSKTLVLSDKTIKIMDYNLGGEKHEIK